MAKTLTDKEKQAAREKAEELKGKSNSEQKTENKKAAAATGYSVPERIWNFLTQEKGLGSITTAAIMGNIAQESNYNINADSSNFDGNGSIGLCQWTFGRKTALINFASSQGKTAADLEVQLNFLWQELQQRGDVAKTQGASKSMPESSREQIYAKIKIETKAFCDCFEIPNPAYANYENRYNRAIEAYEKQGKGILAAGTYTPGAAPGSSFMGQNSAAKRGVIVEHPGKEREGHVDEYLVKPDDPDKTFCEPIYPDLTSLGEDIPAYALDSIPTNEMELVDFSEVGAGLVYKAPTLAMVNHCNDQDILAFTVLNESIANQRKELFKKSMKRSVFKVPSAGKPPNNKDPFPVDHKIVELETHQPRCKIESVKACHHSLEVAKAVVLLSTDTEKRLVKIENNMATMMRYLYRMAGRVNINCVYYGGQIPGTYPAKGPNGENNKYCCIRCLKDNRIEEGKQVSLDQCLNCTRYEPLIGQVYDILNDTGDNLSVILDDNQMSYTTMDEYMKFRNIDERQQPMEAAKLDAASAKTRNQTEINFDDEWGPGLAMDWALYPVELQQPHTNPPVEGSLSSAYGANSGQAITNAGAVANMLIEARNQIDASNSKAKDEGAEFAKISTDEVVANVKAALGKDIRDYYQTKNISSGQDTCLIAALMKVYGAPAGTTIDKYEAIKTELKGKGVDNIVLHVMFYSMDTKYLFGDGSKDKLPVRLDEVKKDVSSQASSTERDSGDTSMTVMPTGAWNNVAKWNWNDISEALAINITGQNKDLKNIPEQMINFAKVVYLYKELLGKCSASRFDTAEWGFPFSEEQIQNQTIGLNYSSPYGPRNIAESANSFHYGIDIGVGGGASAGHQEQLMRIEIHASRDGIVSDIATFADNDGGGQQVYLNHGDGTESWYMHLSKFAVNKGDRVTRGQVIGYTGGSGKNNNLVQYDEHLHYEIHVNGQKVDPAPYFGNNFASTLKRGWLGQF